MSFFKDIKDELAQAVNDIEAGEKEDAESLFSVTEDAEGLDEELLKSLFEDDSMVEKEAVKAEEPKVEAVPEVAEEVPVIVPEVSVVPVEEAEVPVEVPVVPERPVRSELSDEDRDAVTVITKGTTINGGITADCSLDVMGTINGDIECLGKLTVSGKVRGNCLAAEIYLNTDRLEGSITSEGSVKIGLGTVIIGNVTGTSAVIAGAVKGDIDVAGPVIIDSTAIIKGNIKAKSVQMNNGAVLEGFCSLSYASVSIDNIFE